MTDCQKIHAENLKLLKIDKLENHEKFIYHKIYGLIGYGYVVSFESGCTDIKEGALVVNGFDGEEYEVSIAEVKSIINFSNGSYPTDYYELKELGVY